MTDKKVAYFSMEIMLDAKIPIYSGGLGVLAGDILHSASDSGLPLVGVTLNYSGGYFHQQINGDGWQVEKPISWSPEDVLEKLDTTVEVNIGGRNVKVGAWKYELKGAKGHKVPVLLLDTNIEGNDEKDKKINRHLYDADPEERIKQEIILGVAGVRMLDALGYDIKTYHMNEGHSSFLTLELLRNLSSVDEVKKRCVFTTHTPVSAAHDFFSYEIVRKHLGSFLPHNIKEFAGESGLSMSTLAFSLSGTSNAVSKKHSMVSKKMFPDQKIESLTNGVSLTTWISKPIHNVLESKFPGYRDNPSSLKSALELDDREVWDAHQENKERLIEYIASDTPVLFSKKVLTIGFARRFTNYKRPYLIFMDTERLKEVSKGKVQFVFAGKTHPRDHQGKMTLQYVFQNAEKLRKDVKIAFLENYSSEIAKKMVSGCDLWLNTPRIPQEASGTSGMKAAANGVINFSTLDGWWPEGLSMDRGSGFSIGNSVSDDQLDSKDIYDKLEKKIIPDFYFEKDGLKTRWIEMMKRSISLASYFNTRRLTKEYKEKMWKI
jgi:starch phosphorylase